MTMPSEQQSLSDPTVVLNFQLGRVSTRKKLKSDTTTVTTDIDRSMLHLAVELFDAVELDACCTFQGKLRQRLRALTTPSTVLRNGMYLVSVHAVEAIETLLNDAKIEFAPLVEAFADVVDKRRDESKLRLKDAYKEADYPTKAQVIDAFSIDWAWLTLSTPSSLKKINAALFQKESAKAEA